MDKELTPKQQTSEAIRQAETILLITGQHPNIDQVASTIALAAILRKFGKKVTAVISDDIPPASRFLPTNLMERDLGAMRDFIVQIDLANAEVDKLKYVIEGGKLNINVTPLSGGFSQRDVSYSYGDLHFDLVIVLGVASFSRIDKLYTQNLEMMRQIPLVNIDFHRINEQYGAINLLETSAASLAEILIALAESLQSGLIDADIATTMLTALYASTDRFTAVHTTAKTMTVAAQMVAGGADQQKVVKNLFSKGDRGEKKSSGGQPSPISKPPANQPAPVIPSVDSESPADQKPPMRLQHLINPEPGAVLSIRRPQPAAETPRALRDAAASAMPDSEPLPTREALVPEQLAPPTKPAVLENPEPKLQLEAPLPAAEPLPAVPPQPDVPAEPEAVMEDLLPPQHIELSTSSDGSGKTPLQVNPLTPNAEPEPLINDSGQPPKPPASPTTKSANPTNNPIFAQRLDEFEY